MLSSFQTYETNIFIVVYIVSCFSVLIFVNFQELSSKSDPKPISVSSGGNANIDFNPDSDEKDKDKKKKKISSVDLEALIYYSSLVFLGISVGILAYWMFTTPFGITCIQNFLDLCFGNETTNLPNNIPRISTPKVITSQERCPPYLMSLLENVSKLTDAQLQTWIKREPTLHLRRTLYKLISEVPQGMLLPTSILTLAATASSVALGTSPATLLAAELVTEIAKATIYAGPFADASHAAVLQIQNCGTDVNMVLKHLTAVSNYYDVVARNCFPLNQISHQVEFHEELGFAKFEIKEAILKAKLGDFAEAARHAAQANKCIDHPNRHLLSCALYNLGSKLEEIPNMDFES